MQSFLTSLSLFFYNIFLLAYTLAIRVAYFKNPKAKQWVEGRTNAFENLAAALNEGEERIWIHCASLGEFEQGRPLIEKLKQSHPELKIVLTFFSPSGYELRKNYPFADYVFYLPLDGRVNSRKFLDLINPKLVIFVKYEFWYYYFLAIERRKIPLVLISTIFRKSQPFFNWYGWMFRKMLFSVSHFFVQDNSSQRLLQKLDLGNSDVCGDTRIDRVLTIASSVQKIPVIENFIQGQKALIGGSIYIEEAKLISEAIKDGILSQKIILAPHNIEEGYISGLQEIFDGNAAIFSRFQPEDVDKKVLIVDTIGLLSSIYQYGSYAIIGGGFGKSIHNILEPAAFNLPILFGPNFHKFKEAHQMIASGAAFSFHDYQGFSKLIKHIENRKEQKLSGNAAFTYLRMNSGGTEKIYSWLTERNLL